MKAQAFTPVGGLALGWMSLGADGVHPLFEAEQIRQAFNSVEKGVIKEKGLLSAHSALREMSSLKDITAMRKYLSDLPDETVDLLVFLYFRSLDQFLELRESTFH